MFFFNDTATTEIYTLSLHDALPISRATTSPSWRREILACNRPSLLSRRLPWWLCTGSGSTLLPQSGQQRGEKRSEEHTSELQSRQYLVCRLLLEKKKTTTRVSSMKT